MSVGLLQYVPEGSVDPRIARRWVTACQSGANVVQHPWELAPVWRRVAELAPQVYLEIGSEQGGSLYVYAGACAKGATIIAVDDGREARSAAALAGSISRLRQEGFDAHWLCMDSHNPATRHAVVAVVGGRGVDWCHIDGDHSEAGARQDWRDYGSLVRPGGLVAFHDIAIDAYGVPVAWAAVRDQAGQVSAAWEYKRGAIGRYSAVGIGLARIGPRQEGTHAA